jgi:queuosine precursor transporter
MHTKKQRLYLVLCGIFLTNAVIAELIGVKLFSIEAVFGSAPAQLDTPFGKWDFNQTAGAIIWPFVFITSDLINEYFGKKGVRFISFLTAILIAYSFVVINVATQLPPTPFWLDSYPNIQINEAFRAVFSQGSNIVVGSITAFLIGQLLDAQVFHQLKSSTGESKIWLRATGSTLVSQLVDSFVVIYVAFYFLGKNLTAAQCFSIALNGYVYKFMVAILLTPLLYLAHWIIDRYLAEEKGVSLSANES